MSDLYCQTAENRRLLLGCNPVSFCTLLELLVCFLPEFGAIWVDDFTVSGGGLRRFVTRKRDAGAAKLMRQCPFIGPFVDSCTEIEPNYFNQL
tara:strand:- start:4786 stop:5064 length:279 start_codon:yes stop_codon:yes gene_type:complete